MSVATATSMRSRIIFNCIKTAILSNDMRMHAISSFAGLFDVLGFWFHMVVELYVPN